MSESPLGRALVERPVTVTHGHDGRAFLVTLPGPLENRMLVELATAELTTAQRKSVRKQILDTRALALEAKGTALQARGKTVALKAELEQIALRDLATGNDFNIELLKVQHDAGEEYLVPQGAGGVQPNPAAPNLYLLERGAVLYLVDLESREVKFVGNAKAWQEAQVAAEANATDVHDRMIWGTEAHWSPDGRQLAFLSNRDTHGDPEGSESLWIFDMEGGEERLFRRGERWDLRVLRGWVSNEELLVDAYQRTPEGQTVDSKVLAVSVVDGRERQLARGSYLSGGGSIPLVSYVQTSTGIEVLATVDGKTTSIYRESDGEVLRSANVPISAKGLTAVLELQSPGGQHALAMVDTRNGSIVQRKVLGTQLRISGPVSWVGEQLVVSVEEPKTGRTATYLLDSQP